MLSIDKRGIPQKEHFSRVNTLPRQEYHTMIRGHIMARRSSCGKSVVTWQELFTATRMLCNYKSIIDRQEYLAMVKVHDHKNTTERILHVSLNTIHSVHQQRLKALKQMSKRAVSGSSRNRVENHCVNCFSYNIIKSTDSTELVYEREEPVIKLPLMNELCEYYVKHEHKAVIMTA